MWTVDRLPVGDLRIVRATTARSPPSSSAVPDTTAGRGASATTATRVLVAARAQLEAYFARDPKEFDLPLAPGRHAFQQRVWDAAARDRLRRDRVVRRDRPAARHGPRPRRAPSGWPTAATRSRS